MEENAQPLALGSRAEQNTAVLFLRWLFMESTIAVVKRWFFFLRFGMEIFSVPLLVRTFFSPWHRYWTGYAKTFDPKVLFESLFGNIMSRVIGMLLRIVFIVFGIIFDALIFMIGLCAVLLWVAGPFLSVYMVYIGFKLFFLGHV